MTLTEAQEKEIVKKVDDFVEKVKSTGTDVEDKKTQLDMFKNLIDSDFDIEKINPEQISEYDESIQESGGAVGHALHAALDAIEGSEIVQQQIISRTGAEKSTLRKVFEWIKKVLMAVPNLIDKAFFKLARVLGISIEGSKVAGKIGLGLFAVVCGIVAVVTFPSLIAGVAATFGTIAFWKALAALFWGLTKAASAIYNLWKKIKGIKTEVKDEKYTTNDFLTDVEPLYMKSFIGNGKKVPTNWVYDLEEMSKSKNLSDKNKERFYRKLKQVKEGLKKGDVYEGQLEDLSKIAQKSGFDKAAKVFNDIKAALTLTEKDLPGLKSRRDKKAMSLWEVRKIVREVLIESYYDKDKLYSKNYIESVTKNASRDIKSIVNSLEIIDCTDGGGNKVECVKIPEVLFVYVSGRY